MSSKGMPIWSPRSQKSRWRLLAARRPWVLRDLQSELETSSRALPPSCNDHPHLLYPLSHHLTTTSSSSAVALASINSLKSRKSSLSGPLLLLETLLLLLSFLPLPPFRSCLLLNPPVRASKSETSRRIRSTLWCLAWICRECLNVAAG